MKWHEPLYLSESMQKKVKLIKWKLNHNAGAWNGYVLTFSSNPENLLDIYPMKSLKQNGFWKEQMEIVGMAGTYEEALELVQIIIEEVYRETQSTDIRAYINKKTEN